MRPRASRVEAHVGCYSDDACQEGKLVEQVRNLFYQFSQEE